MSSPNSYIDLSKSKSQISKQEIIQDYLKLTSNLNQKKGSITSSSRDQMPSTNSTLIFSHNSPISNHSQNMLKVSGSKEIFRNSSGKLHNSKNNFNNNQELSKYCKNLSSSLSGSHIKNNKKLFETISYSKPKNVSSLKLSNLLTSDRYMYSPDDNTKNIPGQAYKYDSIKNENNDENLETFNGNSNLSPKEIIKQLKDKLIKVEKEKEEYKLISNKYIEISKQLGEEVIILRNQLDKFLHYKK